MARTSWTWNGETHAHDHAAAHPEAASAAASSSAGASASVPFPVALGNAPSVGPVKEQVNTNEGTASSVVANEELLAFTKG